MSNFTVTIEAHEICEAIKALASAIMAPKAQPTQVIQTIPAAAPAPIFSAPVYTPAPVQTTVPPAAPAPIQTPPPAIPTVAPTYTKEQLAIAATQLVDANRRGDLVALLKSFNVPALTMLPPDQYGAFATELRNLGAKI
ncbi:MAG: hypothetical protein ACYCWE_09735 [Eubacteriales bacterium]